MNVEMDEKEKNDRIEAWNRAVCCFGTAKIFEKRLRELDPINKRTQILGFVTPLLFGCFVMFSDKENILSNHVFLFFVAIFSFIQLFVSLWALVDNWNNKLGDYTTSISENMFYAGKFEDIGRRYSEDKDRHEKLLQETILSDDLQRKRDIKMNISAKEIRYGRRYALSRFQRKCAECGEIPIVDSPNKNCSLCKI